MEYEFSPRVGKNGVEEADGEEEEGVAKEGKEVREVSEEATAMVALLLPLDSLVKGLRGLAVEGEEREDATCKVVADGKVEEEEEVEVEE